MKTEEFKFIKPGEVRTRYAPAPTGHLHIGGARTALFNYLFAKKYEGVFILRIEDTDVERSRFEFEKDIIENLKWLGIEWDEGPIVNTQNQSLSIFNEREYIGNYGPYKQSERLDIYAKYLKKLLNEEKAYYCFCSKEELESQKQYAISEGLDWRYNGKCSQLSLQEIRKNLSDKKPYIIRFKTPSIKIKFEDLVRGKIEFDASLIGDIPIAKDIKTPLYNFACVIDDFEMKISYILRGEDHLSNTPKQILLQEALGFPQPQYAHLPLILGVDRTKLSKRHGAVAIVDYKKDGYLPETLINFMAFLGWNPGTEREIYSTISLIKEFSIEKIQKAGAIFNVKKLDFLNGFYIRQKSSEKLTELCLPYLIEAGFLKSYEESKEFRLEMSHFEISETKEIIALEKLEKIISIYQERLKKLSEISQLVDFFFKENLEYDKELLKWGEMTDKEIKSSLDKLKKILSKIKPEDWTRENLEKILMLEAEKFAKEISRIGNLPAEAQRAKADRGYLLWPLRVALTGKKSSAAPFEIAEILGKEKTIKRIIKAKELIK